MCAAALQAFRVERVVYGATNPRLGAFESAMAPPPSAEPHPFAPPLAVTGGVLADDASDLMRAFFRKARERRPYSSGEARGADGGGGGGATARQPAPPVVARGLGSRLQALLRRLTRAAWL